MKIQKSRLKEIIREELAKRCLELLDEAPKEKADVSDAEGDNKEKSDREKEPKRGPGRPPKADTGKKPADPAKDKAAKAPAPPEDQPGDSLPDDPQDNQLDDPSGGSDKDNETAADVSTGGELSKELEGKTIQSITMEPKSKILPGAQEINITFSQIPEPLRILVNKSGKIVFSMHGLHNKL